MSRKKGRVDAEESSEIDLTPMLDVVFIMLIFFIVTASFIKEKSIALNVPEKQEEQPPNPEDEPNILVSITANNEIWLDQRRIDVRAVRANIARLHAEFPKAIVIVKANENAEAKTFVAVADAAREAGVNQVSLARID
ncbi:MAG: biopolymer transporter ExbD [Exilibacterium sp.]